jgi:hypothetical protein
MRMWTAATPSADCLFRVTAQAELGGLGSNGQVMSAPVTTRTTDASPTTSSTSNSGVNFTLGHLKQLLREPRRIEILGKEKVAHF